MQIKTLYKEYFPENQAEINDSDLNDINIKKLDDVFFYQEGPGIRNWQNVTNGINYLNIRCIQDMDLDLSDANQISELECSTNYKHFMLQPYDLVVSTSGTLGKYVIIREDHLPLCLNTSLIRFRPNDKNYYAFMYSYITSADFERILMIKAGGSAQLNFGPTHLSKIKLKYPNEEEAKTYNSLCMPIIENILSNLKEIKVLKQLSDILISSIAQQ